MFDLDFEYLRSILSEVHNDYPERQKVVAHMARFLQRFPKSSTKFAALRSKAEQVTKVPTHEIRQVTGELDHLLYEMQNYNPATSYFYVGYRITYHENGQDEVELFKVDSDVEAIRLEGEAEAKLGTQDHNTEIQIRYEKQIEDNPYFK